MRETFCVNWGHFVQAVYCFWQSCSVLCLPFSELVVQQYISGSVQHLPHILIILALYDSFLRSGSNVEKYTMGIGDDNRFVAVPDAVICHPTTEEDNLCAVVEVSILWQKQSTNYQDSHIFITVYEDTIMSACIPNSVSPSVFGR